MVRNLILLIAFAFAFSMVNTGFAQSTDSDDLSVKISDLQKQLQLAQAKLALDEQNTASAAQKLKDQTDLVTAQSNLLSARLTELQNKQALAQSALSLGTSSSNAQSDFATAQLKALQSQQSLSDSAVSLKTDSVNAQNDFVSAQNNLLNSQITGMKMLLPSVQSGVQGSISGDGGTIRSTVEGWKALNPVVASLAGRVHTDLNVPSRGSACNVIVNPSNLDDYVLSKWLTGSLNAVSKALPNKIISLRNQTPKDLLSVNSQQGAGPSGLLAIPALSGAVVDSIVSISKLFRVDRSITGGSITTSNEVLFNAWAAGFAGKCQVLDIDHLLVPNDQYITILEQSKFEASIKAVSEPLAELDRLYQSVSATATALESDPTLSKAKAALYDTAVARWKDTSDKLHQAIDPIASIPITSTDSLSLKILRGVMLDNFFETQHGAVLYSKVEALGNTRVIKKTTFVSDKEYESIGYVVSFRLIDQSGSVIDASINASNSPYTREQLP